MTDIKTRPVLRIVQTALFLALLIAVQHVTKPAGQLVTGSLVNFILIAATLTAGLWSGLTVALISPVLATLLGISPQWFLMPAIAVGNAVLVLVYFLLLRKTGGFKGVKKYLLWLVTVIAAAAAKFAVLHVLVVRLILPAVTSLKPPQVEKMSAMFTWPQLFTALIGGAVAMLVVPPILAALRKSRRA